MKPRTQQILRNVGGTNLIPFGLTMVGLGLAEQDELQILIGGAIAAIGVRLWFTEPTDREAS